MDCNQQTLWYLLMSVAQRLSVTIKHNWATCFLLIPVFMPATLCSYDTERRLSVLTFTASLLAC